MGLEIARSVLETGGDVICVDQAQEPLQDGWCKRLKDTTVGRLRSHVLTEVSSSSSPTDGATNTDSSILLHMRHH